MFKTDFCSIKTQCVATCCRNTRDSPLRSLASVLDLAPRRLAFASEHSVPRKRFSLLTEAQNALQKARFESRFRCV